MSTFRDNPDTRMKATSRSAMVLQKRALIKKQIAQKQLGIIRAIEEGRTADWGKNMRIEQLLRAKRGWGEKKVEKFLRFADIEYGTYLGELRNSDMLAIREEFEVFEK